MFVVFEGIDGSGKSTVSNRVAKMLRARGVPVEHVREDGSYASPLVNRIREFNKDVRNLSMTAQTELLMNTARDVQLADEHIRPALSIDALVIADRYLYSHTVIAEYGHGLPPEQVQPIVEAAAGRLWPDLVVLMDIDPYVARARRRVSKLVKKSQPQAEQKTTVGGSRKGLQGAGMLHRLRAGYLDLAQADPERWLIIDNSDPVNPATSLYNVVSRVSDAIFARWQRRHLSDHTPRANRLPKRRSQIKVRPPTMQLDSFVLPTDFQSARRAFFNALRARATREVDVAAYFLARLDDELAWQLRAEWVDRAPHVIAYGLRGLDDERAWALRERLAEVSPHHVARSLGGRALQGARVWRMREHFIERYPAAIAATIRGDDSERAWRMREALFERDPAGAVSSLARLDNERSWRLRERYLDTLTSQAEDGSAAAALIESVRSLDDERSWRLRRQYLDVAPTSVLGSLTGLEGDDAWELRFRFADHAPKIVLRSFDLSTHDHAWSLREEYAPRIKEALDSMDGINLPQAWEIRERYVDIWPSTVIKSLGALALFDRGRQLTLYALERHPGNISLLRHVARLATMERPPPGHEALHAV